jgi:hypothetical protein
MKRVFAALITLLFLFNIMGYYFVFSYRQDMLRGEMKTLIKAGYFNESLVILRIVNPSINRDFKRVGKGEFRFREKLYDIVSEVRTGNVTTFRCINDNAEEKLLAGFHRFSEFALCQNNPVKAKHAMTLLNQIITIALPVHSLSSLPFVPTKISYNNPVHSLFSIFHPPSSPPPKSA